MDFELQPLRLADAATGKAPALVVLVADGFAGGEDALYRRGVPMQPAFDSLRRHRPHFEQLSQLGEGHRPSCKRLGGG